MEEYISSAFVARKLGVSNAAVSNWRARGIAGMPPPDAVISHPASREHVWLKSSLPALEKWHAGWKQQAAEFQLAKAEKNLALAQERMKKLRGELQLTAQPGRPSLQKGTGALLSGHGQPHQDHGTRERIGTMAEIQPAPVISRVIERVLDRRGMSEGIRACQARERDFSSELEMQLAGIAMMPEARELMTDALTEYWDAGNQRGLAAAGLEEREVIIGAGYHAAVYSAGRVLAGFPRPAVLEQGGPEAVGGAFAMSMYPVFRLNSRNRPGAGGPPDQDKALNYLPGGLIQPAMLTSEEYSTNADMAWVIRLALAQFADVYPGVTIAKLDGGPRGGTMQISTGNSAYTCGRVIDATGAGNGSTPDQETMADGARIMTFPQFMRRMGGMFPLRGLREVAVIGGGDSAKCAVESLLGLAPGHTSAAGLDYVTRVDWYAGDRFPATTGCAEFRAAQRGRYIRIAQYLEGNASNASTRLRVLLERGFPVASAGGVLAGERTYDMAVMCAGSSVPRLDNSLSYFSVRAGALIARENSSGTVLATRADPFESVRIGPAADIGFSAAEERSGITDNPASRVAMFRLGPRTAALAARLKSVPGQS